MQTGLGPWSMFPQTTIWVEVTAPATMPTMSALKSRALLLASNHKEPRTQKPTARRTPFYRVAWEGGTFLGHCGAPRTRGEMFPPLWKTMLQDKRVLALKRQKGGVACVPTPASKDLRVQRRQQGQTAGLQVLNVSSRARSTKRRRRRRFTPDL